MTNLLTFGNRVGTCIYCSEKADSLEHVLPAAFGEFEGAPNLQDRLCQRCNRSLGLLDENLSRCGPEGFLRKFYAIEGRSSHDRVNPFSRGSAGGKRIVISSWDSEIGEEVHLEIVKGIPRQLLEMIFIEQRSQRKVHLPLREDMTASQLLETIKKLELASPFDLRISCDAVEMVWVEKLVKQLWPTFNFDNAKTLSKNYPGARVAFELNDRYARAIAKVGFHYFLTQFTRFSGREPIFDGIREFILKDGPIGRANDFIRVRQTQPPPGDIDQRALGDRSRATHFLRTRIDPGKLFSQVEMFRTIDWPTRIYTVRLARYTSIIAVRAACHVYNYSPNGNKGKFVGECHQVSPEAASFHFVTSD